MAVNVCRTGCTTALATDGQLSTPPMRVLEFFSGLGGWHMALQASTVHAEVVGAFELNPNANVVYAHNFPPLQPRELNIGRLQAKDLDSYRSDMWVMSPPCQPFTRLGKRKDLDDHRTDAGMSLVAKIPQLKHQPRYVLLENVQGFESSEMRKCILATLSDSNYSVQEFLLDPRQIGLPNARLRYYLLATRSSASSSTVAPLQTEPPIAWKAKAPSIGPRQPVQKLRDYLEWTDGQDAVKRTHLEYAIPDKVLQKSGGCIDIVFPGRSWAHLELVHVN